MAADKQSTTFEEMLHLRTHCLGCNQFIRFAGDGEEVCCICSECFKAALCMYIFYFN